MSGFYAASLLLLAFLMVAVTLTAARTRDPPTWLTDGASGEVVSLLIVGACGFGIAYLVHFFATLGQQVWAALQVAALGAAPLVAWALWHRLRRWDKVSALFTAKASIALQPTATGERVPVPTAPEQPHGEVRKAA